MRKTGFSGRNDSRRGFSAVVLLLVLFIIAAGAGGGYLWFRSAQTDDWKDWKGPRTPDVQVRMPNEMEWSTFATDFAEKTGKAAMKVARAPLLSGLMVGVGEKRSPATIEKMKENGFLASSVSAGTGLPFASMSQGVFASLPGPFSVSAVDVNWTFSETPNSVRTLSTKQTDLGETTLEMVLVWNNPKETDLAKWTDALKGFFIAASRTTTGEGDKKVTECFMKHPDGHAAFAALFDGKVEYIDAVFGSKARDVYFEAVGDSPSALPARLPGAAKTGLWTWRERGAIRADMVKSSYRDGEYEVFSLLRWTDSAEGNRAMASGFVRTWRGFLLDVSLWFERPKWDVARGIIFPWFNMGNFNFVELVEPVIIDGIEMRARNVDDSVVVVTMRDSRIAELASYHVRASASESLSGPEAAAPRTEN